MSDERWSWRPSFTDELRRNSLLAGFGIAAATVVSLVVAVVTPGRFVIVLTVLLAGIGVLWLIEHRRFRSTRVSLGADGTLEVADGRASASIGLASVDTVAVRLRTQPGLSVFTSPPKWTIELSGPDGAITHPIAHAGGLFNPAREEVERLETELNEQVRILSGRSVPLGAPASSPGDLAADDVDIADTSRTGGDPSGRFEWRPPVSPNADRRRTWFRMAYVGAALLIAVLGAVAAWGDWVGVVLSAVTVPGLVLAICGGLDWGLGRSRRFALLVADGRLSIKRSGAPREIDLRGATVSVDRNAHHVATGSTTMRTTSWMLSVTAADGAELKQMLPSFGTTTREEDYVALERELRRRT